MESKCQTPTDGWRILTPRKHSSVCCSLCCCFAAAYPVNLCHTSSRAMHAVVADQNTLTSSVLSECETRQQFNKLLTDLFDYPRYSCPKRHGKRYNLKLLLPSCRCCLLRETKLVGCDDTCMAQCNSGLIHAVAGHKAETTIDLGLFWDLLDVNCL